MTTTSKPKSWRDVIKVHPAANLFPMMTPEELKTLGEDIEEKGLITKVAIFDNGDGPKLVDGRNRLDAMELLGLPVLNEQGDGIDDDISWTWKGPDDDPGEDAYTFVLSANIHRRHLTPDQRRDLIAKVLKAQPSKSNRTIAKQTKTDHKTVGTVRERLEAGGEIPHVSTVEDSKGRQQPAHKPPTPLATTQATTDSALVRSTPDQPPPAELIIAKCVEDVTNQLGEAIEHLDEIGCVRLLEQLQAIISMLLATANKRAVESILGEEPPKAAEPATEPETKPPNLAEPPPEMVECPKCHGTGNLDDDGIPEFLRRQSS